MTAGFTFFIKHLQRRKFFHTTNFFTSLISQAFTEALAFWQGLHVACSSYWNTLQTEAKAQFLREACPT